MYNCLFFIDIIATDGVASGQRQISLPFPPSFDVGLMGVVHEEHNGEISEVESIAFDVLDGDFYVTLESDIAAERHMCMDEAISYYDESWEWEKSTHAETYNVEDN